MTRNMALATTIDDAQSILVAIHNLHDTVLVEVKQRKPGLPRSVVVWIKPYGCETILVGVAQTVYLWVIVLFLKKYNFRVWVIVDIAYQGIACG